MVAVSILLTSGLVAILLGLLSVGFVIPRTGRNLFTDMAGTGIFRQIGLLLILTGLALLGLVLLIRKPKGR
jgi:hypothetical protein